MVMVVEIVIGATFASNVSAIIQCLFSILRQCCIVIGAIDSANGIMIQAITQNFMQQIIEYNTAAAAADTVVFIIVVIDRRGNVELLMLPLLLHLLLPLRVDERFQRLLYRN
jgi:hypothetical protein